MAGRDCHTKAAAANAELTEYCSVIDCKLSFPPVLSRAQLASRPTLSHLLYFPLSVTCLTPTLPFFPSLFSCHPLFPSLSPLKTFSISTHTFSIILAYQFSSFLKNSSSRSSSPGCLVTVHPTYTAAHCCSPHVTSLDWLTASLYLSPCLSSSCYCCSSSHLQAMVDMCSAMYHIRL